MADVSQPDFDPFAGPVILATAPSTEPQREIWTACALGDDASLAFNESVTIRLSGALQVPALRQALSDLVARHEALRTTLSGDGLTLLIGAGFEPTLGEHDYSSMSPAEGEAQLARLLRAEVDEPFDLGKGPLFRAHVLRFGESSHALVFTAHHIVCDGWSTAVLMHDWAVLYNARAKGEKAELPPPEALGAYARRRAEGPSPAAATNEEYWLKCFTGELPILDLPADRPRPERKSYRAGREDFVLEPELVAAVRKAGGKARASLFATLLAGFKALVFRLSAQPDVIVGVPVAGQAAEGLSDLVGHCVNMLPLRSGLRADEPFVTLLGRVRTTLLDAQDHQDFTFGTLLTKLPIPRDPSRLPLVSVIFNLDRGMTSEAIGFENIHADLKANPRTHENFELFVNAVEIDGRIELEAQYNRDLFDAESVRRWLHSYRLLLSAVASAPDTEVGALPITTQAELEQISGWNATDVAFPRESCVHELVEAAVQRDPAKTAVEFNGAALSYGELDARANRLARELRARGVRRGALVGLCLERGVELMVGLLGIHKAGGAYVPLDPGYPKERLSFMVQDSGMRVLLTDSTLARELAFGVEQTLCIDQLPSDGPSDALAKDADSATPLDPAYVIYTSGSTGKPKGVLVPQRAVCNLLNSVTREPGLAPDDVVLAITTLSFDIAVSEVWLPLVVGAKIVMVSREVAADGVLLKDVCERQGVTFIDATPATYRLLLAAGFAFGPSLKLICTGEAMPKDLALELPRRAASVWNGYGPTETTVWSTFWRVPENTSRVLIGRPVDNTRIHVLDARMQRVPIGVSGELYIAGEGVTLGYLNRPELTAERFIADPFDAAGARMYRTGDVGRYLGNGDIECLGRNDNQVKLRGFRIELGEIEDALLRHEGVAGAAVILREDRPGDARLVGYVVARAATAPAVKELRQHLQRTLPDYMIPATYVVLPRLPLTPSGKIDRRALPAPEAGAETASASDFVEPRTETERLLAELWASALNVGRISVHDDFFALGGHSLLASQILSRLRRDHGIELSFRRFFEAPSVARLAELIDGVPAAERTKLVEIRRRPPGTEAPLSLAQERLWLLEEMHPAQRVVHNLPSAWRLKGELDATKLQQALDRIAARHEALRTTLKVDGNRAVQQVAEKVELPIELVDLRNEPAEKREQLMFERIRRLTAEPFDLKQAPLFRSTLFRLADAEHLYFTVRHNIIWDGWSFDVFLNELCTIYDALERGVEPKLPELPVSYGDFAVWQREWIKTPALSKQVAFWQERLSGNVPDLRLPLDHARPAQTEHAGGNTALAISRADVEALTSVAHRAGTTLFNLLYAAYSVVLHRFSGQAEIVVGTPVRARNLPEVENLIGPFINAIVLRSKLEPSLGFLDYLARVRDMALDSFSNQDMPLELLGSRPPIVRAFFSFQDAKARSLALGKASVAQVDVEPPAAANDLMLWLMDRPHELLAVANFSTEVFEHATIRRFLRSFVTLLRDIAMHPNRPINELMLLAPEDRQAVEAFDAPAAQTADAPAYRALLERETVGPSAAALVLGTETISFAELARRARACAQGVAQRVEAGQTVALVLSNPLELATAAWGGLLAGVRVAAIDSRSPEAYRLQLLRSLTPALVVAADDGTARLASELGLAEISATSLAASSPVSEVRGASAAAGAWLRLSLDAEGGLCSAPATHAELAESVGALASLLGTESTTYLAWSNASYENLPFSLLFGATLGIPTQLVSDDVTFESALTGLARANTAACALAPASAWESLLAAGVQGLERVTALVDGYASSELLSRLTPRVARTVVLSTSSPPESVVFANLVVPGDAPTVLGRPLTSASVAVLDASLGPIPLGAVGNLALGRPHAKPIGATARLRADGRFELVAEARRTALIDGQRFDPAYVARMLSQHPAVRMAAVKAVRDESGERLVAYFEALPGVDFTDTELRRHLRASLPEPMLPRLFIELPTLPLAADGSVDLDALPLPFGGRRGNEFVAPRTENERIVAELYAEALGLKQVGVYDNFFDLGGHSLLCFRVIERLEARVGKRLSPRSFLLGSLEQVAAELSGGAVPAATTAAPAQPPPAESTTVTGRVFQRLTSLLRR